MVYWFVRPQCRDERSYCHGLPNSRWHTVMGATSHSMVSTYSPTLNGTFTLCAILMEPQLFSHCTWYGWGCFSNFNPSLSTISLLARLWQLPPSMITLHTFPPILALVWNRLCLCPFSASFICTLKIWVTTRAAPPSNSLDVWASFLVASSNGPSSITSCSSSLADSYCPWSFTMMVRLFGHSLITWPRPPHLKHWIPLVFVVEALK